MKIVLYLALFLLVVFVAQNADAATLTASPRYDHFGPNDWLYIDLKIDGYVGGKVSWVAHRPDNSTSSGTLVDFPGGMKVHLIPRTAFDNYFGTWSIDYTYNDIKKTAKFVVDPIVLSVKPDKDTYYSSEVMKLNITTSYFIPDATKAQNFYLIFNDKKGNPVKDVEKIDIPAVLASHLFEFPINRITHSNPLGQYKVRLQYYNTVIEVPFEIGDISKRMTVFVGLNKPVYNIGDQVGLNLIFSKLRESEAIIRVIHPSGDITTYELPVSSVITKLQLSKATTSPGKHNLEVEYSGIIQTASFVVQSSLSNVTPNVVVDLSLDKIKYRPGEIINAKIQTNLVTNSSNIWFEDPNGKNGTVSSIPLTSTDTITPHKINKDDIQGIWKMHVNYAGVRRSANFFVEGESVDTLDVASLGIVAPPKLLMKIGSDENVQFKNPMGIAVDSVDNIYVLDSGNFQIKKFSPSGKLILSWGSYGSENGQFKNPSGIFVDKKYVYVADTANARIQKFDQNGNFIHKWGSYGNLPGLFQTPVALAASNDGNLYVSDSGSNKIQIFDSNGQYKDQIQSSVTEEAKFSSSNSIAFDSKNNFYIVVSADNRILQYSAIGAFTKSFGSSGNEDGQFNNPRAIVIDSKGNLYVTDSNNYRIQKFDLQGKFSASWGSFGIGAGQFTRPVGLALDQKNNLYVLDNANGNVQEFAPYSSPDEIVIPNWVRSHAKWWAHDGISDSDFAGSVQYLIRQNIISLPNGHVVSTDSQAIIPQWIKSTAGWWANRLISDKEFAGAIQYLISRDIIKV